MIFSIEKNKKAYARYLLILVISLPLLVFSIGNGMELLFFYLYLTATSIVTITFSGKTKFLPDIILPLNAVCVGIYVNHLLSLFGKLVYTSWGFNSIILYTILFQDFWAIAIELFVILFLYYFFRTFKIPAKISALIAPLPLSVLCIANYFVYRFRRNEIVPLDITSIGTALNVSKNYNFSFKIPYMLALGPILLYAITNINIKTNCKKKINKHNPFIYGGISLLMAILTLVSTPIIKTTHPVQFWGCSPSITNGYITNFALLVTESKISKPVNYDSYEFENLFEITASDSSPNTNIIVIMNESFADLSIYSNELGEFDEVLPFYRNLANQPNTRTGYVYTSVFGGNTANSEYEFLTGLSTEGLPTSAIPYSLYIKKPTYSLTRYLSQLGYSSTAMHPYLQTGWNRTQVYPNLGFDNMMFLRDFNYTSDDIIRIPSTLSENYGSMSDECAYRNLLDLINENSSNEPDFYFLVTIQNHGGYSPENEKLPITEYLPVESETSNNSQLNVFFSNANRSDSALEYLLSELSNMDERYVVLMFGDHQPALPELASIEDGSSIGNIKWITPFIIWTNYDMPSEYEGSDISTSVNYLSLDVLNIAGINLPPYFEYISNIRTNIPIINSTGYYSTETNSWHDVTEENEYVNAYYALQYYSLFDNKIK